MGPEHKSKKRGRSSSPLKKKLKRKYRNDRSKKYHDSSSESSSSEVSLTSDEYPSSAEERRKEAKKKRSKKPKRKACESSASSSRSPTPEKAKKKSKSREDSKKDRHKKDRKRSPASKKKKKRGHSDDEDDQNESSDSHEPTPVRKEKSKKKHSPSPVRVRKKKSVSPSPTKENDLSGKNKKSASPPCSKKRASSSPPRKGKQSISSTRGKKDESPSRKGSPVVVKRSSSPIRSKRSPSRGKKKSASPPPMKSLMSPQTQKESLTSISQKQGKESPVMRRETSSPVSRQRMKERASPISGVKSRSPTQYRSKNDGSPLPNRSPSPQTKIASPVAVKEVENSSKDPSRKDFLKKERLSVLCKKNESTAPVILEEKKLSTSAEPSLKDLTHGGTTLKSPTTPSTSQIPPSSTWRNVDVKTIKKLEPSPFITASKEDDKKELTEPKTLSKDKDNISIPFISNNKNISGVTLLEGKDRLNNKTLLQYNTRNSTTTTDSVTSYSNAKSEVDPESLVKSVVKTEQSSKSVTNTPSVSMEGDTHPSPVTSEKPISVPIYSKKTSLMINPLSAKTTNLLQEMKKDANSKKNTSPAAYRSRKKSSSPSRSRKKSKSPSPSRTRRRSRSSSLSRSRRRSKSPKRERKRSRSPHRNRKDPKRRSRSSSPSRSKNRDRSPDKKRKNEDKRKDEEKSIDKKDRDEKDKDKFRRSEDNRRGREDRSNKDDKDRRKKDDKEQKMGKRDKSPEKKDISELEEEMKKRKERIEAWRNVNRKKSDPASMDASTNEKKEPEKKWSLEDDEDEDEEQMCVKEEEVNGKGSGNEKDAKKSYVEDEEDKNFDPLDSFMKGIDAEVNKITGRNTTKPTNTMTTGTKTKTVTVVKTVVSKISEQAKPEVMEQNQDALEYSSEEEGTKDIQASDFTDATKKKKELTVADHSKIYYAPFRRDFYVEVPELARMSADEVKLLRDNLGDIQVRGKNVPKPIKSWAQAGLSAKVMSVLKKSQYEKPTPIQAQALPIAMSGRDMIGIAKTGSGKTLGFVLPMLRHVLDQSALDEDDGPIAIIMTPTRELALQIYKESKKFCKALNLNVTCIYGGSGISEQIAELKRGTEIIVCTPGRMIDMLAANNGRVTNCRRCTYLVLDEADRMFDMGFEPQVMRIIDNIRPDRQTVLFSATFPRQMEAMARKVLTKPIEIQVGGRSVVCSDIEQHAIVIEEDNKFFKILELLGAYQEEGSILLFVERQETADRLFKDLLKKGYPCLSLHGGMDQFDRDSTIADFKNGVTKLMVSTSVAARGLDVKNLILVINYDCPNHYEDYVHRVGRTGRAGNKGEAFTFLTPEQGRNAGDVMKAFELSKNEMPQAVVDLWNSFKEDMEKEGKTIKMNSGFTGKGFKFNAEEDAQVNEEKKMRKFTLGLQDSDDEAEAAENAMDKIEADLDKIFSSKPKVALQPEVVEAQKVKVAEQNVDKDKLKQASSIAALINKKLSSGQVMDRNTQATAHIMQGGALESLTGVGLAKQLADKVNAKLNYKAAEVEAPVDEKPTLVRYEEEIDINDFPQQARWRITSKEIIEQVRELSEAGVTVRGLYLPPNKKPTEEEKRLHLYIESLSERSIQIAKAEIKRLLKEELIKAESNTYRPAQQTGRYKVL